MAVNNNAVTTPLRMERRNELELSVRLSPVMASVPLEIANGALLPLLTAMVGKGAFLICRCLRGLGDGTRGCTGEHVPYFLLCGEPMLERAFAREFWFLRAVIGGLRNHPMPHSLLGRIEGTGR
jgi:hypothetical protein